MNDVLEILSYKGFEYYSWGGDNEVNLARRSKLRPLGRGHRLALIDDCVLWVTSTDILKTMVDCYEGSNPSLATTQVFQLMVSELSQLGAYTSYFTLHPPKLLPQERLMLVASLGEEESKRVLEEFDATPLLEPVFAIGIGMGVDNKGYFMAVVLVHSDGTAAELNVKLLEQQVNQSSTLYTNTKWIDLIEAIEIDSQDLLTFAKFYGKDIAEVYNEEISWRLMPLLSCK